MKPACARELGTKLAHVKISLAVDPVQPREMLCPTAAIVEIELIGLVDEVASVLVAAPKLNPPAGIPPITPG